MHEENADVASVVYDGGGGGVRHSIFLKNPPTTMRNRIKHGKKVYSNVNNELHREEATMAGSTSDLP